MFAGEKNFEQSQLRETGLEILNDLEALQRAAKGPIITQMEMHAIEALGLIKIDILGNRSLGVLSDCLRMIEHGSSCQFGT